MAEALGVIASAVSVLSIVPGSVKALRYLVQSGSTYRHTRFGLLWGTFLYFTKLVDTDTIQTAHWNINCWTDDELLAWKQSYMASCNSITVAAAIFASVGLTSLQLPNIDQTHWIVRALLSSGMGLGVMSSMDATLQQRKIAYLNDAISIRLWLSRGGPIRTKRYKSKTSDDQYNIYEHKLPMFGSFPLESSVSAWSSAAAPMRLLYLAYAFFIIGFGLYFLFSWLDNVEGPSSDWRNTFIFFACVMGAVVLQDLGHDVSRALDAKAVNDQFNVRPPDGFERSKEIEKLEKRLRQLRTARNTRRDTSIFSDVDDGPNPFLRGSLRLPKSSFRPMSPPDESARTDTVATL